jgi:hypothetical protein
MKKVLLIALLILGPLATASGQSAEESAVWLNTRLMKYVLHPQMDGYVGASKDELRGYVAWHTSNGDYEADSMGFVQLSGITDVIYTFRHGHQEGKTTIEEAHIITLIGPYQLSRENEVQNRNALNFSFELSPDVAKEEVDRVIKAIKHLATLDGAKLSSDDLFK